MILIQRSNPFRNLSKLAATLVHPPDCAAAAQAQRPHGSVCVRGCVRAVHYARHSAPRWSPGSNKKLFRWG